MSDYRDRNYKYGRRWVDGKPDALTGYNHLEWLLWGLQGMIDREKQTGTYTKDSYYEQASDCIMTLRDALERLKKDNNEK